MCRLALLPTLAITAISLGPTPVVADPAAELALTFGRNLERGENFKRIESSFALPVAGSFGLQFDLATSKYQTADTITPSGALHLTWGVSEDLTLGVFAFGETPNSETVAGVGLEVAYRTEAVNVDAYAAAAQAVNDSSVSGSRVGIDVTYKVGGDVSILGGAASDSLDGTDRSLVYLGAGWQFNDAAAAIARIGQTDVGDGVLTLGVTLNTAPVTFGRRDAFAGLRGY